MSDTTKQEEKPAPPETVEHGPSGGAEAANERGHRVLQGRLTPEEAQAEADAEAASTKPHRHRGRSTRGE